MELLLQKSAAATAVVIEPPVRYLPIFIDIEKYKELIDEEARTGQSSVHKEWKRC